MSEEPNLHIKNNPSDETSLRYMLKLAAPMIVVHVSFTIMQFVDRFMVSRLGTEALAAILPAGMVSFIPGSFLLGVMTCVNTFVSQSLGRGKKEDCSNYCWQGTYMGLAYFIVTFLIMWPSAPFIFKVIGQPTEVIEMEVTYLRIMLYCHFLLAFIWASSQFFMGIHRPIITMYAAIAGQVVNVIANYTLIFGKFGFPAMGIAGAGWGTFIGLIVGAAIRMAVFLSGQTNITYKSRKTLKLDLGRMLDLIKIGFPAGVGFMVSVAFWGVIIFGLVGKFGKEPLAATSAVFSCMNVSFMPIVGISTALTAAAGKAIGQGRKEIAIKQTRLCLKIGLVYMGFIGLCFLLFRNGIMKFWAPFDDKVIAAGVNILFFAAFFQIFDAMSITYNGLLRGAGDTIWLACVSAFGSIVLLGIGGWTIVTLAPGLGERGPWIAALADIIFISMANHWRFKSKSWMRIDLFKRRVVEVPEEIEPLVE